MKSNYFILWFILSCSTSQSEDTLCDIKKRESPYQHLMIEESPFVALVTVRRAENCRIKNKYCGATILTDRWILSSAECFNSPDDNDEEEFDYFCLKDTLVATKVDAIPPDTEIITHEIERVILGNNSISVHSENVALIKLKAPINFDESQKSIPIAKPTEKPKDSNCLELIGFKYNEKGETENLRTTFISITSSCYKIFPEIVNDCFCTTEYNYNESRTISHFLAGTSVVFNNKLIGFDPNTITFKSLETNVTYAILINTADMYEWIMNTIN